MSKTRDLAELPDAITVDGGNVGIGTSSPSAVFDVRRGDADGKIAEFHQSSGYGFQLSSSQSVATITAGYNQVFTFETGTTATERMRIDASGNVGIGTSSPNATLTVSQSGNNLFAVERTGVTGSGQFGINIETNSQATVSYDDGAQLVFGTASSPSTHTGFTERMKLDSSGNVGIDCSPTYRLDVDSGGSVAAARLRRNTDGSLRTLLLFLSRSNSNTVGSISISNSATAYNTSSDHRLKENVDYTWDATTRLKQLKPARFNFIADGADTTVDGFLAHEAQTVVPECVTGTKDAVDADGNPEYQGIDQSKLVPLLVKTIQELEARITALEA